MLSFAPHTKSATGAAEWSSNLPPKGDATLEYSVKTTF